MQDQHPRSRGVVQVLPGQLDLLQLAENLVTEGLNGVVVAGLGRVCAELAVQVRRCLYVVLVPGQALCPSATMTVMACPI